MEEDMERWSCEKANFWYEDKGRITGCNFIPSDCINGVEIWQEYKFAERLETIKRELGVAQSIGINSIRMVMPYEVWLLQHDGFMKRLECFLDIAQNYGITLMPVLFDDCCMPKSMSMEEVKFGEQPMPTPGYHGGFKTTPFDGKEEVGYIRGDDKDQWPMLEKYVKDLVCTFGQNEGVLVWDIWNEPGNSRRGSMSLELMTKAFEWAREMKPIQPLTAGPWSFPDGIINLDEGVTIQEIEQKALELSDITSFHYYGSLERTQKVVESLRQYNRPLVITEWLHRIFDNTVEKLLPYYAKENISCYHWGLVTGKTQTNEPWELLKEMKTLNLNKWQHDLYYTDLTPYNPEEIDIFKQYTK